MNTSRLLVKTTTAVALLLGAVSLAASPGCSDTGRMAIPSDADRLGSGRGEVTTTATHDGEVWILDDNANKIVWSGNVRRDDRILIDPADNQIKVDGRTVSERALDREHQYIVYIRR